ncbi:MAG: RHS repeat-associated core domain-containing protein [Anaerohalosphaeraceae bacterium]
MGNYYAFTGRELDRVGTSQTGFLEIMYYRARYYDPDTGRFLQPDPLGLDPAGGRINPFGPTSQYTDGMNAYEYAKSSPLLFSDAEGLAAIPYWPIGPGCGPMYTITFPDPPHCEWRLEDFIWIFEDAWGYYWDSFPLPNPYYRPGCGAAESTAFPFLRYYPIDDKIWQKYAKPEGCKCVFHGLETYWLWCCNSKTDRIKKRKSWFPTLVRGELIEGKDYRGNRKYSCKCDKDPDGKPINHYTIGPYKPLDL